MEETCNDGIGLIQALVRYSRAALDQLGKQRRGTIFGLPSDLSGW